MRQLQILSESESNSDRFMATLNYLGVGLVHSEGSEIQVYVDLDRFLLDATRNLTDSRLTEGILCWIDEYGHLLSPSKIRKLIKEGVSYDPAVLGGLLEFIKSRGVADRCFKILRPYAKKSRKVRPLWTEMARVRKPAPYFHKYNLLVSDFAIDLNKKKFLRPKPLVMKNCIEIKNRSLFGSVVHADVASALSKDPTLNAYATAKMTGHHKARVFKGFKDIRMALGLPS